MAALRAKIVIQNRETLKFFKGENEWAAKIDEARRFTSVVDANSYIRTGELSGVDILMNFGDQRYDVKVHGAD